MKQDVSLPPREEMRGGTRALYHAMGTYTSDKPIPSSTQAHGEEQQYMTARVSNTSRPRCRSCPQLPHRT